MVTETDAAVLASLDQVYGAAGARELIASYLEDSPRLLAAAREALAARDGARLREAAHQLKATSAIWGASALRSVCLQLETLGRENRLEGGAGFLVEAQARYEKVRAELLARLNA